MTEAIADTELDDLLRATARADRAAFQLLYNRTSAKLFGITVQICRDRALAEEVLQDVYVEIWLTAGTFNPRRGRAMPWLMVIARNKSIEGLRKHKRGMAHHADDGTGNWDILADPRQMADGGVAAATLRTCLGRLAERERDLVLRAYFTGESREELSMVFDAPVTSIKTWLRRGLASLRACLDE